MEGESSTLKTFCPIFFFSSFKSNHWRCSNKKLLKKSCSCLQACHFLKKRVQHRCFPMHIAKTLRTSILKNICERLFLLFAFYSFFLFYILFKWYKAIVYGINLHQFSKRKQLLINNNTPVSSLTFYRYSNVKSGNYKSQKKF